LALVLIVGFVAGSIGCESSTHDPFTETFAPQTYKDYVPPNAQTVASGTGILKFQAPAQGRLFLVDLDDMIAVKKTTKPRLVGAGLVLKGADVTFNPTTMQITSPGKDSMKLTKVVNGHRHELRYLAADQPEQKP
jgi:hypothetical protein